MEKSKKKKIVISILALIITASAITGGFVIKKRIDAKKNQEKSVKEVTQKTDTVTQTISFDGSIEYDDEIIYYADEDDKLISKVLVEVGDYVEAGQTLIEYDMDKYSDLENDLKKAKLELATLEEDLRNLTAQDKVEILSLNNDIQTNESKIKEYETSIKNNENLIKQKKSKLSVLEKTLKQDKELYEKGYKSSSDIKDSENTIDEYKDSIEELTATNETLKRSIETQKSSKKLNSEKLKVQENKTLDKDTDYEIKVKKLAIEKQKIEIASIEKDIKKFQRYSKAEKSGVVTKVNVTDGATVSIGTELVAIADNTKLIINADVSEYEVNKIALGDEATISGDGFEKSYTATVTKILPVAEADSDDNIVVPIELTLEPVKETIRNNYTVSVVINKTPKTKSTLIPVSAIVKDSSGKSYVNVMDTKTNKTTKKEITTGEIKGTEVEVVGLSSTDKVVEVAGSETKTNDDMMGPPGGGPGAGGPPPGGGGPN